MSKKVKLIIGGVTILSIGAYLAFRKRKIAFYDNIWCDDDKCSFIDSQSKVNSYMGVSFSGDDNKDLGNGTGMLTLVFPKPHGLIADDEIMIEQNKGAKYDYYNGVATITSVPNPFVIVTNKARQGDTPTDGGVVYTKSFVNKMFN